MKVFILKSVSAIVVTHSLYESKDFYLIPQKESNNFDIYDKDVFKLTIEEAEEKKC